MEEEEVTTFYLISTYRCPFSSRLGRPGTMGPLLPIAHDQAVPRCGSLKSSNSGNTSHRVLHVMEYGMASKAELRSLLAPGRDGIRKKVDYTDTYVGLQGPEPERARRTRRSREGARGGNLVS